MALAAVAEGDQGEWQGGVVEGVVGTAGEATGAGAGATEETGDTAIAVGEVTGEGAATRAGVDTRAGVTEGLGVTRSGEESGGGYQVGGSTAGLVRAEVMIGHLG